MVAFASGVIAQAPAKTEKPAAPAAPAPAPAAEKPKVEKAKEAKAMRFGGVVAAYEAGKMIKVKGAKEHSFPHNPTTLCVDREFFVKVVDFAREHQLMVRRMYETWHLMQRFLRSGQFDPRPTITHRFPLEKIDDAIAAIRSGDAGKVILEIGT